MFCRYCGTQIETGAKFCGMCGNAIPVNENSYAIATEDTYRKKGFYFIHQMLSSKLYFNTMAIIAVLGLVIAFKTNPMGFIEFFEEIGIDTEGIYNDWHLTGEASTSLLDPVTSKKSSYSSVASQYNEVVQNARNSTWEANCQTVTSAIAMYQAGHDGATPKRSSDLDRYISGGFDVLQGQPSGARYYLDAEKFESTYPDYTGYNSTYQQGVSSGGRYIYYLDGNKSSNSNQMVGGFILKEDGVINNPNNVKATDFVGFWANESGKCSYEITDNGDGTFTMYSLERSSGIEFAEGVYTGVYDSRTGIMTFKGTVDVGVFLDDDGVADVTTKYDTMRFKMGSSGSLQQEYDGVWEDWLIKYN